MIHTDQKIQIPALTQKREWRDISPQLIGNNCKKSKKLKFMQFSIHSLNLKYISALITTMTWLYQARWFLWLSEKAFMGMKEGVCFRDNYEVMDQCWGSLLRTTVVKESSQKTPMLLRPDNMLGIRTGMNSQFILKIM